MAIEVFNRYEHKYLLNTAEFGAIRKTVEQHMDSDPYNIGGKPYTIANIYYEYGRRLSYPKQSRQADVQRKAQAQSLRRSQDNRHRLSRNKEKGLWHREQAQNGNETRRGV